MSEPYIAFGTFRHIGSIAAELTESMGRAAIARCLDCASQGDARAFQEADQIRQRLGVEWPDLIEVRRAA